MEAEEAAQDLRQRTLAAMTRPLDRVIYLASMRDYNTGVYYHEGLASRFGEDAACQALADCHREAFRELFASSLKDLVDQVEAYMLSTRSSPGEFLMAWKELQPYRVAVPIETEPPAAELVFSNIKIALAILEVRRRIRPAARPTAWLRPSLGQ
jgi:hypothetical protein